MLGISNSSLAVLCLISIVGSAAFGALLSVVFARLDAGKTVPVTFVIGLVVAGGLLWWADYGKSSPAKDQPTAAPAPSTTATPSPDDQSPEEPQTTSPAPPEASEPVVTPSTTNADIPIAPTLYYLADLNTQQMEKEGRPGRCDGGCTGFNGGAARIQGKVYPNSYLMQVAADGRRSTASWNLARSCSTLNLTVGLNDRSAPPAQVTFTISTDGGPSQTLATVGQATPGPVVDFPVSGVAQIQIAAFVSGAQAERSVDVVLGDAQLACNAGSLSDES